MIAQIQMRRGTTAEWAAASPVVLAAGEMGLDTTIQKSKIGDGTTEWASLPWLNGDVTNPNLLHNWDFRNPVNQRGADGFIAKSTPGYGIDRWRFVGSYIFSGYLTVYPEFGNYLEQKLEPIYQALYGKTVTVSMYTNVGYISASGVFPASGSLYLSLTPDDLWRVELISDWGDGCPAIRLHVTHNSNAIYAIKLELGPASTLHLDPPMDRSVELPKCQRFYAKAMGVLQYWTHVSGLAYFLGFIAFPVTMRINPTMVYGPCTISNIEANIQGLITWEDVYNNREIREVRVNRSFTGSLATPLTLEVTATADL